jgi:hypothetical protein
MSCSESRVGQILSFTRSAKHGKAVLFEKYDNNVCSSWKLDFSFFRFLNHLTPKEFYAE